MLQGMSTVREAREIKNILNDFVMARCIEVSLNKSKFFSLILIFLYRERLPGFLVFKGNSYLPNISAFLLLINL